MNSGLRVGPSTSSSPFDRALKRIPWQLRRPEIRFTIIPLGQKSPIGKAWDEPGGSNYGHEDPMLAGYLASGWNYGVVTGLSGLAVVDIDNLQEAEALGILARLPETFQVRTGGGGQHHYYWCPGLRRISFYHPKSWTPVDLLFTWAKFNARGSRWWLLGACTNRDDATR